MKSEIIDLIQNFEGVIGAILGVVVTLIMSHILKNSGKLIIYPSDLKVEYKKEDQYGAYEVSCGLEEAKYVTFDIDFDLYNSSEIPNVFRDLKFTFYENNLLLHEVERLDIHISTAFYWRHKILNAHRSLGNSQLNGIIESDGTHFLESEKGRKGRRNLFWIPANERILRL